MKSISPRRRSPSSVPEIPPSFTALLLSQTVLTRNQSGPVSFRGDAGDAGDAGQTK